jgi:hypothetical protein
MAAFLATVSSTRWMLSARVRSELSGSHVPLASSLDCLVWAVPSRFRPRHPSLQSVYTSHMVRHPYDSLYHSILIAYSAIPIALRMVYSKNFVRGPFHLGPFSYPVATAAVTWIAFISVVFCLPEINPVDSQTLNYAPVAVGIVIVYAFGFWIISARKWFTGPVAQIVQERQGVDVMDPEAIAHANGSKHSP